MTHRLGKTGHSLPPRRARTRRRIWNMPRFPSMRNTKKRAPGGGGPGGSGKIRRTARKAAPLKGGVAPPLSYLERSRTSVTIMFSCAPGLILIVGWRLDSRSTYRPATVWVALVPASRTSTMLLASVVVA